jgi:hypothetical protein
MIIVDCLSRNRFRFADPFALSDGFFLCLPGAIFGRTEAS